MKKIIIFALCLTCFMFFGKNINAQVESVIVVSYAGDVKVFPGGGTDSEKCKAGMFLPEGTRVITGDESYVQVTYDRAKTQLVKVKENSEVVIKIDGDDKVHLIEGKVYTLLKGLKKGKTFRVRTPAAVCGARGTGWLTEFFGDITTIGVFDDKVFARGIKKDGSVMEGEEWIKTGYQRKVKKFERPGKEEKIPEGKLKEMKAEFSGGSKAAIKRKVRDLAHKNEKRESQMESIQEKKDKVLETKEEDKTSSGSGFGSITIKR